MERKHWLIHIVLILGAVTMLVPFYWMLVTSLKTLVESTQVPPTLWPQTFVWTNYSDVWNSLPFAAFYVNTFGMIFFRIIGSVFFSATAAYAFARLEFPGRDMLFGLVLVTMMIPGQLFLIPQYEIVARLGQVDTLFALVMPGLVSAFGTFLLRQFFLGIPKELEEAAILDGCNRWQIFWKVMLPLASGLASLQGQYSTNFPQLMAGSVIAIWPMVVLFIIFQKQFIQGVAGTGSKS